MFKTLFAVLVAACAFLAIACLLHAPLISAAVVAHPLLFVILVAAAIVVTFLHVLRPEPRARAMRFLSFGLIGAAAVAMSGCSALQGLTAFNSALVPQLKPVDARIHTDVTCGDMAAQVLGVTAGTNQLSAAQAVAIVQFCERRDATQTLTLDPEGARKVLNGIVNKPAGLSAGGLIAPVAAAAVP